MATRKYNFVSKAASWVIVALCVLLVQVILGGISMMLVTIIFYKICQLFAIEVHTSASVVAFIFGFLVGNSLFLPTFAFLKSGQWPEKVAKTQISEEQNCKN